MSKKAKLRKQLADGKTRQVIDQVVQHSRKDQDLHNDAVSLSARFQKYLREKHGNTTPTEELDIELNRIHSATLDLIRRLPEDAKKSWLSGWRRIAAGIASVVVFGAAVAELSGYSLRDLFVKNEDPAAAQPLEETKPKGSTEETELPADTTTNSTAKPDIQPPVKDRTPPEVKTEKPERISELLPNKLNIACKTDKGTNNLQYQEGETMRLYFKTNLPCHIRIFYRFADGSIVLFDDDRELTASEVGDYVEIGSGYEAAAPFGEEELLVFAQSGPFPALRTMAHPDGYTLVTDGLPEAKRKTRAFKKKYRFAETSLKILTTSYE